jgi:hypothetical protein
MEEKPALPQRRQRQGDYSYLRAHGRYMGSHHGYILGQVELARADGAPERVINYREPGNLTLRDMGPDEVWISPDGQRAWVLYRHWSTSHDTRAAMTRLLAEYDVDPADGADATPEWRWLSLTEVPWRGWALYRLGKIIGYVQHTRRRHAEGGIVTRWMPLDDKGVALNAGTIYPGAARQRVEQHAREIRETTRVCQTEESRRWENEDA